MSDYLEITDRAVRKQLTSLLEAGVLTKIGKPPKVFYSLKKDDKIKRVAIKKDVEKIINENFLFITPTGETKTGIDGFIYWCDKTGQEPVKTASEYVKTAAKYKKFKKNGLINGQDKFKNNHADGNDNQENEKNRQKLFDQGQL